MLTRCLFLLLFACLGLPLLAIEPWADARLTVTRLAPVETYGLYLLILSWALVLYGATCQWPKFA